MARAWPPTGSPPARERTDPGLPTLAGCRRAHDQREVLGHAAGGPGDILGQVEEVSKVRDEHEARYRRARAASRIDDRQPTEPASQAPGLVTFRALQVPQDERQLVELRYGATRPVTLRVVAKIGAEGVSTRTAVIPTLVAPVNSALLPPT